MPDLFLLSADQMSKIEPFFPKSHGIARVDDRRVISGIIYVLKNAFGGKSPPKGLWPSQDSLQSFPALDGIWCFRPYFQSFVGCGWTV